MFEHASRHAQVSMIDTVIWQRIAEVASLAQQTRGHTNEPKDEFGNIHLICFGDFKRLVRIDMHVQCL